MIGHSMGGCTALAIAGAVPWSMEREQIEVTHDERVKALVLFAPAAAWFQHPDSFNHVNLPMVVILAEHDTLTPYWQADLIKQNVKNSALVTVKNVKNAGHLSFLAPFPESMRNKNFPPSQDPDGFDREAFHETLKAEVIDFFNKQSENKAMIEEAHNNQFISTSIAEKMSALRTQEYLESRALRGNRDKFDHALSKIGRNNPLDENDVAIK